MSKYQDFTEDHIDLLHTIEKNGNASQREIAGSTGLSIGKVNYIIRALIDVGFIKINNFSNSNQKLKYAYVLTPKGIKEKTKITMQFIHKKELEYKKLKSMIDE